MLSRISSRALARASLLSGVKTPRAGSVARSFRSSGRSLAFLDDYQSHVAERAATGPGIAPKPLDAKQVSDLVEEYKVS